MAQQKFKTVYVCSECGAQSAKWNGKCPTCGRWNTLEEETIAVGGSKSSAVYEPAVEIETPPKPSINIIGPS